MAGNWLIKRCWEFLNIYCIYIYNNVTYINMLYIYISYIDIRKSIRCSVVSFEAMSFGSMM